MTLRRSKRLTVGLVAIMAMTLSSGPVFAAEEESPMKIEPNLKELQRKPGQFENAQELFKLFDDNGDGVIDSGEWRSQKMLVFYGRDIKQDYRLSRDELPGISDEVFAAADQNGDGYISAYEFNQAQFTQFEDVDLDRAGTVTYEEFLAYLARLQSGK